MGFQFKRFYIEDSGASMKVGTDAVLLGSWAGSGSPGMILDVGSGSGLIALMMAQRFPTGNILAIDIQDDSIAQSIINFEASPWNDRLSARHISLQDHATQCRVKYDLIVSNPPFFRNSLRPADNAKMMARHTDELSYKDLLEAICKILHPSGSFNLILPFDNQTIFEEYALQMPINISRKLEVIPVTGKKPNRVLTEWRFNKPAAESGTLTIRNKDNSYTEAYKKLTDEFYLAL